MTLNTPQFSRISGSVFYIWGRDENFYEWSPADIKFLTLALDWRPNDKIRVSPQYQLQSYDRRTDGSTVGIGRIPRLKVEYQVSRAIFVRAIGEYNAQRQDTLRDDSRTNLPILIRDASTGLYAPATAFERNRFRLDALFSYQPTPGTVFFAGYSSFLTEPHRPEVRRAAPDERRLLPEGELLVSTLTIQKKPRRRAKVAEIFSKEISAISAFSAVFSYRLSAFPDRLRPGELAVRFEDLGADVQLVALEFVDGRDSRSLRSRIAPLRPMNCTRYLLYESCLDRDRDGFVRDLIVAELDAG